MKYTARNSLTLAVVKELAPRPHVYKEAIALFNRHANRRKLEHPQLGVAARVTMEFLWYWVRQYNRPNSPFSDPPEFHESVAKRNFI